MTKTTTTSPLNDTGINPEFPPPPIKGSSRLVPITSWLDMFREQQVTGVEFDEYWYEGIEARAVYFFSWLPGPRSTVLVVWNDEQPVHIECRSLGGALVSGTDAEPIITEVTQLFRDAGFWFDEMVH